MKNEVIIVGRFIKTPTLRVSKRGTPYTTFILASQSDRVTSGNNIVDYIRCIAFDSTCKSVIDSFGEGDLVQIEGSITTGSYTNGSGERTYSWNVVVDKIAHINIHYTIVPPTDVDTGVYVEKDVNATLELNNHISQLRYESDGGEL